ncbi:MAG: short-chain dehydrogenase [Parafilimonas sp.]|nr:short-chain dehydrogenase [Parafilimonas sp.]
MQKFFSSNIQLNAVIRISFKTRNSVLGIFIQTPDITELKSKNFWRIVSETDFQKWNQTHDYTLCRMFNGAEFTKLSVA